MVIIFIVWLEGTERGRSSNMLITEYRIIMPLTVPEYQLGQRYAISQASLEETGGGEGIEVLENRLFSNLSFMGGKYTSGRYTKKIFHLKNKVPKFVKAIAPVGSLVCPEESWNCYPYCKTIFYNPQYMKDNFLVTIETMHLQDRGTNPNALELSNDVLEKRKIVYLDIADSSPIPKAERKPQHDPLTFRSSTTGRGPLSLQWYNHCSPNTPIMCCYKLVKVHFHWTGIGSFIKSSLMGLYPKMFTKLNREVFCQIDVWHPMTPEQMVDYEAKVKASLDQQRNSGQLRGAASV